MIDFKIKGTKLPVIPAGFEFKFKYSNQFIGWSNVEGGTGTLTNFRDKHFSFGSITYKNEIYILAEYKDYDGKWFFMYKESDIIKLAKEQGMIEEEFKLPEKWCVKDCKEVSLWASKSFGCGVRVSSKYLCVNQKYFPSKSSYIFTENKDYYTEITFEQFCKYILNKKENNMKEIIGYKLIKLEYRQAVSEIIKKEVDFNMSKFNDLILSNSNNYYSIKLLIEAGVLDLWFEPVYKTTEKTVSVGGKFDVVIKDGKIWHKSDDITDFVEGLNNAILKEDTVGGYKYLVSDIVFSKTGCQNVETKLSDWFEIYKTYKNLQ